MLAALAVFGLVLLMKKDSNTPLGIRNNNPLNIRTGDNWQGMTGSNGGFVVFDSPVMGFRAAFRILKNYRDKYNVQTIGEIISRWAPPSENDTGAYIAHVESASGISRNKPLSESDYLKIVPVMVTHENGFNPYSDDVMLQGFNLGFA